MRCASECSFPTNHRGAEQRRGETRPQYQARRTNEMIQARTFAASVTEDWRQRAAVALAAGNDAVARHIIATKLGGVHA